MVQLVLWLVVIVNTGRRNIVLESKLLRIVLLILPIFLASNGYVLAVPSLAERALRSGQCWDEWLSCTSECGAKQVKIGKCKEECKKEKKDCKNLR